MLGWSETHGDPFAETLTQSGTIHFRLTNDSPFAAGSGPRHRGELADRHTGPSGCKCIAYGCAMGFPSRWGWPDVLWHLAHQRAYRVLATLNREARRADIEMSAAAIREMQVGGRLRARNCRPTDGLIVDQAVSMGNRAACWLRTAVT